MNRDIRPLGVAERAVVVARRGITVYDSFVLFIDVTNGAKRGTRSEV